MNSPRRLWRASDPSGRQQASLFGVVALFSLSLGLARESVLNYLLAPLFLGLAWLQLLHGAQRKRIATDTALAGVLTELLRQSGERDGDG